MNAQKAFQHVLHLLAQMEEVRTLAGERDQKMTERAMGFAREAVADGNLLAAARTLSNVAAHLLGEKAPGTQTANMLYLAIVCAQDDVRQVQLETL